MSDSPPIIVGLGEALYDLLPTGPALGGAPLNAAVQSHQLGNHAIVASRVGDDALGQRVLDDLAKRTEMTSRFLSSDAVHPDWLARKTGTQDEWRPVKSVLKAKAEGPFDVIASVLPLEKASAPDLKGFASRRWIRDLLDPDQYLSARYFGGTAHRDGAMYKKFLNRKVRKYDAEEKAMLELVVLALSAEAKLLSQTEVDKADADKIKQGIDHLIDDIGCVDCHAARADNGNYLPVLSLIHI